MPTGWSVPCTQRWVALPTILLPLGSTWICCDDVPALPFPISTAHGAGASRITWNYSSSAHRGLPRARLKHALAYAVLRLHIAFCITSRWLHETWETFFQVAAYACTHNFLEAASWPRRVIRA